MTDINCHLYELQHCSPYTWQKEFSRAGNQEKSSVLQLCVTSHKEWCSRRVSWHTPSYSCKQQHLTKQSQAIYIWMTDASELMCICMCFVALSFFILMCQSGETAFTFTQYTSLIAAKATETTKNRPKYQGLNIQLRTISQNSERLIFCRKALTKNKLLGCLFSRFLCR